MTASPDPFLEPPEDVPLVPAEDLLGGEVLAVPPVDAEEAAAEEAEPRRYPSTVGGALYLVVLAVAGVGMTLVGLGSWQAGVQIVGLALFGAAVARLALPDRDAGMLAVRNRYLDAGLLIVIGVVLILLAGSIPLTA